MQKMKHQVMEAIHQGKDFVQDLLVAILTGALCGVVGSLFHHAVDWATEIRAEHGWLLWLLPEVPPVPMPPGKPLFPAIHLPAPSACASTLSWV